MAGSLGCLQVGGYHWKELKFGWRVRTPGICEVETDQEVAEPAVTEVASGGDTICKATDVHLQEDILFQE